MPGKNDPGPEAPPDRFTESIADLMGDGVRVSTFPAPSCSALIRLPA